MNNKDICLLYTSSHRFFAKEAEKCGIVLGDEGDYGIGMFFFPQDGLKRQKAMKMLETICRSCLLYTSGWRCGQYGRFNCQMPGWKARL